LFFASLQIHKNFEGWFGKIGKRVAAGILFAGLLDILENGGMLLTLNGKGSDLIALFTAIVSAIKWLLAIIAVLYVLAGAVGTLRAKLKNK
jgi:hypothetical protein